MTSPAGVFAAALTPQKPDLSPDPQGLVRHCKNLLAGGCDGLSPLGTTGEANSFSVAERMALLDAIAASDIPPAKLIPGTGSCSLTDAVQLTRRVVEMGAAGALLLPPFYYKGVSDDGLFGFFAEIIQRVGDAKLKIYLYHFPQMTGLQLSLDLIARLLKAYPDTVVGLKNSSGDWANMEAMLKTFPGFRMFAGSERFLLQTLRLGGPGCISASTNVTAPLCADIYRNWRGADADARQERATRVRAVIEGFPAIAALKAIVARQTGNAAWTTLRPPLVRLTAEQERDLFQKLQAAGFALQAAAAE
jgi:4-hydroxy-tetrahydrodipicolinate synthase